MFLTTAQQMDGDNLCKATVKQNTNSQATSTTSQVMLTRHFPVLSQVVSGFYSRHCHTGPKGDLIRDSVTWWQRIAVQVEQQKQHILRGKGWYPFSTSEASAQPQTVKLKSQDRHIWKVPFAKGKIRKNRTGAEAFNLTSLLPREF